jgi:hypothetical protein
MAMHGHKLSEKVQASACTALRNIIDSNAQNATQAGIVGAVEAITAAMHRHPGSARVQEHA